jgi:hypothetical protein
MRWRRTDKVQEIGALIVTGPGAPARLAAAMARKSVLFQALAVAHGRDWAAVFAGTVAGEGDPILPRLSGATALYRAGHWWFPVGTRLDAPDHAQDALLAALAAHHGIALPAILIPRPDGEDGAADIYPAGDPAPFAISGLAA